MPPLLLLHGALGSPESLQPLADRLSPHFDIHCPAFPGHAGLPAERYRMEDLVDFLSVYITAHKLQRPMVFGYSMGGYAALSLAARAPGMLGKVATLATKLHWTPEAAAREVTMLQPEALEQKVPSFAAALAVRHAPLDWKDVLRGTASLMSALGHRPLLDEGACTRISVPVLLLLGDRDKMVTLEETTTVFARIAGAQLAVLPGTPHPLEKAPVELLTAHLRHFFQNSL